MRLFGGALGHHSFSGGVGGGSPERQSRYILYTIVNKVAHVIFLAETYPKEKCITREEEWVSYLLLL